MKPWSRDEIPRFKVEPIGHILGSHRMALVMTPCCVRRMRIRLLNGGRKWSIDRFQKCPNCRRLWRADATITTHGFIRSVTLELAI